MLPKLGSTVATFFGNLFTDVFNSIYNQQIDKKSARNVIIGFFVVVGITTSIYVGLNAYKKIFDFLEKKVEVKKLKQKVKKVKKPTKDLKPKKKLDKEEKKPEKQIELKSRQKNLS